MPGVKLPEPIPIAEVQPLEQEFLQYLYYGTSEESLRFRGRRNEGISRLLGLDMIPLTPTRYWTRNTANEAVSNWHIDGGGMFFESPDVCFFANLRPPQLLRGEIPVYTDWDWENLAKHNQIVEDSIKTGTAETFTLIPNVYYLLRSPAVHRGPKELDPELIRLSGRRLHEMR